MRERSVSIPICVVGVAARTRDGSNDVRSRVDGDHPDDDSVDLNKFPTDACTSPSPALFLSLLALSLARTRHFTLTRYEQRASERERPREGDCVTESAQRVRMREKASAV